MYPVVGLKMTISTQSNDPTMPDIFWCSAINWFKRKGGKDKLEGIRALILESKEKYGCKIV